jgi:hypothetical protein
LSESLDGVGDQEAALLGVVEKFLAVDKGISDAESFFVETDLFEILG